MEVDACHTEGRRSLETDDGPRRYDKAGLPEGSVEQAVFTVKTIFINLYTCRRSAPLPSTISAFQPHIRKTNTNTKIPTNTNTKQYSLISAPAEVLLPCPLLIFTSTSLSLISQRYMCFFFQLHLPTRNVFDTSGICSQ